MKSSDIYFIYLFPGVLVEPAWKHLERFFHVPTLENEKQALMVGCELDLHQHPYLSIRAKDWGGLGGTRRVLIRHDIVASILEVASHTSQVGFVNLSDVREQLADQSS